MQLIGTDGNQGPGALRASRHKHPEPFRETGQKVHHLERSIEGSPERIEDQVNRYLRRLARVTEPGRAAASDRRLCALVIVARFRYQRPGHHEACVAAARPQETRAGGEDTLAP